MRRCLPRILLKATPVLCKKSFSCFGCVKALIIDDCKLLRIPLIRINLRSLRSSILRSFHISPNIKNFIYRALVSTISLSFLSFSREGEELKILDDLIATSERQLVLQKELRGLIVEFHLEQDLFYEGSENDQKTKELASKMVNTAGQILKTSEDHHYLHLFPAFFVEELKLFANISKKKTPPVLP